MPLKLPPLAGRWRAAVARLLLLYLAAATLGALAGRIALAVAITSTALFGWYLWNAYRLDRWARSAARRAPPEALGAWAEVFDTLYRNERHQLARRRTLSRIVREVRRVTNALPDGIVFLDPRHRIGWFNLAATDLLGLRKSQDVGRPLTNLLRSPAVRDWLKAPTSADDDGLTIASPADAHRVLRLSLLGYGDDRRVLLVRDVTELHRTEAMRKDFVANASHELRTPLTVISGYLESMEDEAETRWQPIVIRMREQAHRMQAIIGDLLTLSRLESRETVGYDQEIPMADMLESLLAEARVLSGQRHRISLDLTSACDLRAEPKELRSALMNLITNAVSYTPAGGSIELSWRDAGNGGLEFAVHDDGPGIAARHLPRLTERFYRVSRDRSRQSGGTGLGLAIVKHVMALHGGELRIRSEPGVGSEFVCRFPPERAIRTLSAAS